jgi:lipoprotein-releasing system ATP-binding protein
VTHDAKVAALLEGDGLKKTYRSGDRELRVLDGIDVRLEPGGLVVIVGPSGAGKSTLLYLLGGLDRPSEGKVRYKGKDIYRMGDRERSRVRSAHFGFVFQFYHLVPELTAMENVLLPAWIARKRRFSECRREAKRLLEAVGLGERASHRPSELSGGEQQRVAIARSLMNRPELIFCDEPTGNLDSKTGESVLKLLLELNREQGTTLVIVTHEPAITQMAGRVLSLKDGRLWHSKSS